MKRLQLHRLCQKTAGIFLTQEIHTSHVILYRSKRKIPKVLKYEAGTRLRDSLVEDEEPKGYQEEFDDDDGYGDDVDFMNLDVAYDEHKRETKKSRERLGQIITAKKFFTSRPQPQMLTYHERECIKYLHKQDPVQWDVKTLSESFPATTEVISKILRAKWKMTPERAKALDSQVQKNWELLEEGKLDADPQSLEHFKRFVNRREVLLEKLKSSDFYLPEIKREPVWNNRELSSILRSYEKQIEQLARTAKKSQNQKLIEDGKSDEQTGDEISKKEVRRERTIDGLYKNISKVASKIDPQQKDSFMLGEMLSAYSKETTLDELENQILKKAEAKKNLGTIERAVLETKLGTRDLRKFQEVQVHENKIQGKLKQNLEKSERVKVTENTRRLSYNQDSINMKWEPMTINEMEIDDKDGAIRTDDTTERSDELNVGKLLNKLNKVEEQQLVNNIPKIKKKVKEDFQRDPESIARENALYDREVGDIQHTAFWNNGRNSKEKAMAEFQKPQHDGLAYNNPEAMSIASPPVFDNDSYPEKIKIPKNQRGSGLTFRIKDCYYDDDGEFLYRVPGMTK